MDGFGRSRSQPSPPFNPMVTASRAALPGRRRQPAPLAHDPVTTRKGFAAMRKSPANSQSGEEAA
jgi:hypothetical protein